MKLDKEDLAKCKREAGALAEIISMLNGILTEFVSQGGTEQLCNLIDKASEPLDHLLSTVMDNEAINQTLMMGIAKDVAAQLAVVHMEKLGPANFSPALVASQANLIARDIVRGCRQTTEF